MYLKAVSHKCDGHPSRVWISEEFENVTYRKSEVTSYKQYTDFIDSKWPHGNYYVYHEGFSLQDERKINEPVEGQPDHQFFRNYDSLKVAVFNCHNEEFIFGGHQNHILAGCEVYLLNDSGDTIDKVDLT